jgi:hypothetical protein
MSRLAWIGGAGQGSFDLVRMLGAHGECQKCPCRVELAGAASDGPASVSSASLRAARSVAAAQPNAYVFLNIGEGWPAMEQDEASRSAQRVRAALARERTIDALTAQERAASFAGLGEAMQCPTEAELVDKP